MATYGCAFLAPLRFLTLDGLAIAAWAGAYVALGWVSAGAARLDASRGTSGRPVRTA